MSKGMELAKREECIIADDHTVSVIDEQFVISELSAKCSKYFPNTATVFAWQIHAAGWGKWDGACFQMAGRQELCSEYLQEIRVFDQQAELHLKRDGNKFTGRFLSDEGTERKIMYVDTFARLFGKSIGSQGELATLADDNRQTEHAVPMEIPAGKYVGLITRNYIDEVGDMGQLSYVDYRFVSLDQAD